MMRADMYAAKNLKNYEFLPGWFTLEQAIHEVVSHDYVLLLYGKEGSACYLITATHVYKTNEIKLWEELDESS